MNVMTTTSRLAATGAAAALAAAALVGVTSTAAHADPVVTNVYTCTASGQTFPVTLTTNAPGIEGFVDFGLLAGSSLPGGALTVTNTFTISDGVHSALVGLFQVAKIDAPDFSGSFGGNPVGVEGVSVTMAGFTQNGDGSWSSDSTEDDGDPREGDGTNSPFTAPAAGAQDVVTPAALNLVATTGSGSEIPVSCTIAEGSTPGVYATINLLKNASATTGTPVAKTLKTTEAAKMKVTVAAENHTPSGKVIVKEGSDKLGSGTLNDAGKVTVAMGKLSKGKHTVKIVYKGDGYTESGASDKISFTVVKP